MAHFADKFHVNQQVIDRVESGVLLLLIGSGLEFCLLGAAVYDIDTERFLSGRSATRCKVTTTAVTSPFVSPSTAIDKK